MAYPVYTNKVGGNKDSWKGQVGYRSREIAKAWVNGEDLECHTADRPKEIMTIRHASIYKIIAHEDKKNLHFDKGTGKKDEYLIYYQWVADGSAQAIIDQWEVERLEREEREMESGLSIKQMKLF